GPQIIVDDGGDATLLIHRGVAAEDDASILNEPTKNRELVIINALLKRQLEKDNQFWHNVVKELRGVSEETTTGVHRLYHMKERGELL
ncbi:MAG TPA: adenosylhomocysteinase, partial [Candidatus Latescibacteria bacterium]|nr:adenosylhomocysteinase [Candidatus Latescibacterota bacterium]